jgi:integrase
MHDAKRVCDPSMPGKIHNLVPGRTKEAPMTSTKVAVVRLCKTLAGWRRYPVAMSKNGRIRPDAVVINGKEVVYPEGKYQLRTYAEHRIVYRNIKGGPAEALAEWNRERSLMLAREAVEGTGAQIVGDIREKTLAEDRREFLESVKLRTRNSGLSAYRLSLEKFAETCNARYRHEIRTIDILRFIDALRREGLAERTVWNRTLLLMSFLKSLGLDTKNLLKRNERPVKPENAPEAYGREDLADFLSHCRNQYLALSCEFLSKTGVREQEFMFLEWTDIDLGHRVLTVKNKPDLGFTIKTYQGRTIPIERGLAAKLAAWKKSRPGRRFVFGTSNDRPQTKLLLLLKREVRRQNLNCNRCQSCKSREECERWFLHKFRATFATTALHNGLDIHTVMRLLGHKDLASTMRYLSSARSDAVQTKMDAIFAARDAA